ncbi:MAG: hypothetical protein JNL04_04550 [Rhodospirillaceae bacterium]|nr:hypothetical protein [Rhodospirillaceae bacterium]
MTSAHAHQPATSFAAAYRLTRPKRWTTPWPPEAIFDRDYALALVALCPGISDREMAERVFGPGTESDFVVPICRGLASGKMIERRLRPDGLFGNYLSQD